MFLDALHRQARRCLEFIDLFGAAAFADTQRRRYSEQARRPTYRISQTSSPLFDRGQLLAHRVAQSECLLTPQRHASPRGLHMSAGCPNSARDVGACPWMRRDLWRLCRRSGDRRVADENPIAMPDSEQSQLALSACRSIPNVMDHVSLGTGACKTTRGKTESRCLSTTGSDDSSKRERALQIARCVSARVICPRCV